MYDDDREEEIYEGGSIGSQLVPEDIALGDFSGAEDSDSTDKDEESQ